MEGKIMTQRLFCITFAMALLMSILAVVPNGIAKKGDNLVLNHDFEDLGVQPWTMWVEDAGAGVAANLLIDKKEHVKGKQSLLIEIKKGGPNNKRVELHQNPFFLEKGQKLTYAMWVKAEDVRPAKMIANHRAAPWTAYGSKDITIQQEWTEFWTTVTMPIADNLVGIYVELKDSIKGNIWFDDFRMYEGDYEPDPELGQKPKAVDPQNKLNITWGKLKTVR